MVQNVPAQHGGMDAVVVVRLSQHLREALRAQAAIEDRTMASLLRLAARKYLEGASTTTLFPTQPAGGLPPGHLVSD